MSYWPCLLVLLFSSCEAHFLGTVMTYYPKTAVNGSFTVVLRYKANFATCLNVPWSCRSGACGTSVVLLNTVDAEVSGEWCQNEGIMTRVVPGNNPFQLQADGGNWIDNIFNINRWSAVTLVEPRTRSDTGQANRSPQTTNIPAIRVPSNCRRNLNFLAFDPDGDSVRCRYGVSPAGECNQCTHPSDVTLSSSCTLSYVPSTYNTEGPYAVQLVMEDFPRATVTLSSTSGSQTFTSADRISKIPFQFILRVDPAVPDCTSGLYLPELLPPTPANRASLYTSVNQTIEIIISAHANISTVSELLFSGPHNSAQARRGTELFAVTWTPSGEEDGESHPFCFIVQATHNSTKYHSDLRCVVVTVGEAPDTTTTPAAPSTSFGSTVITLQTSTPASDETLDTSTPHTSTLHTSTLDTTLDTTPDTTTLHTSTLHTSTLHSSILDTSMLDTSTTQYKSTTPEASTELNTTIIYDSTTSTTTNSTNNTSSSPTADPSSPTARKLSTTTLQTPPPAPRHVVALRLKVASLIELTPENLNAQVTQQMRYQLTFMGVANFTLRLVGRP